MAMDRTPGRICYAAIGRNIRAARLSAGITQQALAERLHLTALHLGRIERGERRIPLHLLAAIADQLDVRLDTLLEGGFTARTVPYAPCEQAREMRHAVAAIARGCSARTMRMMALVCADIAAADKADEPDE